MKQRVTSKKYSNTYNHYYKNFVYICTMILDLPKFLSHEAHKYMFYGFIRAFRLNFPDVSVEKAIENFMKYHAVYNEVLDVENFNIDSARMAYYRLDKQFTEMYKGSKSN